jgi:predicted dehydrogenase
LRRLADLFDVVHIADPDPLSAGALAQHWATARVSNDASALYGDPRVDVAVVSSPSHLHHQHTVEALNSGIRAVLCEKPVATTRDEIQSLRHAATTSDCALIVGAMHEYDPAWRAALDRWDAEASDVVAISSRIFLPPNERFESWATQSNPRPQRPATRTTPGERFAGAILGVAVHDLPLIVRLGPGVTNSSVADADVTEPYGYAATLDGTGPAVSLLAEVHVHPQLTWELSAWSTKSRLLVRFPPSFVHAGSASATIRTADATTQFGPFAESGYVHEWLAVWDAANGTRDKATMRIALDAGELAIRIAEDGARALDVREGA